MHIYALVQQRRNSSALAVELRLSCTHRYYNTIHFRKLPE